MITEGTCNTVNNQNYQQQPGYPPPSQQPYPAPATQKKRRAWPWVVGAVVALLVIVGVANRGGTSPGDQPGGVAAGNEVADAKQPVEHVVVYRVDGVGTASSVTYTTDGMTTTNQESAVALPWEKTITLPAGEALQMVSIVAQGDGSGKIDVTVTVDGKLFKEAHADGYGVAMANGNIGTLG